MSRSCTWRAIPFCALGAALLAACAGGGGNASSAAPQSMASFKAQAEPICEEVSAALAEIEPPSSFPAELDDFDQGSSKILAVIEGPYGELASLAPPEGYEDAFSQFAAALTAAVEQEKEVRRLVAEQNDDTDALWLLQTNVKTHQAQAMNHAAAMGIAHCTELNFKASGH